MDELRCKPGDLAIVIKAKNKCNLGRIVRVTQLDQGSGPLFYPASTPTWLTESAHRMTWYVQGKRIQRKRGPIPDAHLQPVRGIPPGRDVADSLRHMPGVLLNP